MCSIRPFYAKPKFVNNFGEFVHHRKDVTYMKTGVCRQHYSMNNPLIGVFIDTNVIYQSVLEK